MLIQTRSKGITFPVHDVDPVMTKLPTKSTRELLRKLLSDFDPYDAPEPLYISDYNSQSLINASDFHPLFSTIHLAFNEHRPLIFSPDMIWITILQGFAQHVQNNAEELRHLLVQHKGKQQITIVKSETFLDSPEYDWQDVIGQFAETLSASVPEKYASFKSDFSTTGPLELLVSQVCILDVFQSYFEYILYTGCGIPQITLEGSVDDWKKLKDKVEFLKPYKIDFWLPHLQEITERFFQAANGVVDRAVWQDFYKQVNTYGASTLNGWILKLIPYIRSSNTGDCVFQNPILSEEPDALLGSGSGIATNNLPSGISKVPFTIKMINSGESRSMEFLAGFIGGEQDEETHSVRPKLGFGVRKTPHSVSYLANLPEGIEKMPAKNDEQMQNFMDELLGPWERQRLERIQLPGTFFNFYKQCDGLSYTAQQGESWKVRGLFDLEKLPCMHPKLPEKIEVQDHYIEVYGAEYCIWLRFLDEGNGNFLALELGHKFQVFRVDEKTSEVELIASSFEKAISSYIDRVRN